MLDVLDSGSWSVSGINKFSAEICGCKAKICGKSWAINHRYWHRRKIEKLSIRQGPFVAILERWRFIRFLLFPARYEDGIYIEKWKSRTEKDTKWVSVCTQLRTPHLVNGFLFTLRLIAGIFSSLWVDGLRLAIFPSPKLRFHLASEMMMMASCSPLTPRCGLRCSCTHSHIFLSLHRRCRDKLNFISETGSLGFLRHDMIILPNINEKWKSLQRICPCHPRARE